MPIVKNYIEMHGGSISVESKAGEGTEFLIELPLYNENLLTEEDTSEEN
jgi:signal transduction histidine kinase